jgi:hypothetical protein
MKLRVSRSVRSSIAAILSAAVSIAFVGLLSISSGSQSSVAAAAVAALPDAGQPTTIIRQASFGIWSYQAFYTAEGDIYSQVSFDKSSIQALKTYAAANRSLAQTIARQGSQLVPVAIIFRTPIAPDQFRSWARGYRLAVQSSALRLQETPSTRSSAGVAGDPNDPLPAAYLKSVDRPILGVYGTQARVAASTLPILSADPLVFNADVTGIVVHNDLIAAGFAPASLGTVSTGSIFYDMENFGLENFQ